MTDSEYSAFMKMETELESIKTKIEELLVAKKEIEDAIMARYGIIIRSEWSKFVRRSLSIGVRYEKSDDIYWSDSDSDDENEGEFVASNGITIYCGGDFTPGFCRKSIDRYSYADDYSELYTNKKMCDAPWFPDDEYERPAFVQHWDRVVKAIEELKEAYEKSIAAPTKKTRGRPERELWVWY